MADVEATESTPLALARDIAIWFPNLEGRSVAVADCKINRENEPQLPLAMVVFAGETAKPMLHSTRSPKITEKIVVEFWRHSEKYKRADGAETPFYAYVDYRRDRDTLLHHLESWQTPDGALLAYQGISVVSDDYAYTIEMHFVAEYDWCNPIRDEGVPFENIKTCFGTRDPQPAFAKPQRAPPIPKP